MFGVSQSQVQQDDYYKYNIMKIRIFVYIVVLLSYSCSTQEVMPLVRNMNKSDYVLYNGKRYISINLIDINNNTFTIGAHTRTDYLPEFWIRKS